MDVTIVVLVVVLFCCCYSGRRTVKIDGSSLDGRESLSLLYVSRSCSDEKVFYDKVVEPVELYSLQGRSLSLSLFVVDILVSSCIYRTATYF